MKLRNTDIEKYYIDFLEGTLNTDLHKEMERYFRQNPEHREELEKAFELEVTAQEDFPVRTQLYKQVIPTQLIHEANYEDWMIRVMEGDASASEEKEWEQFCFHNSFAGTEMKLLQQCRVERSEISFPGKSSLKRKSPTRQILWYSMSAAASVILFWAAFNLLSVRNVETGHGVALRVNSDVKVNRILPEERYTEPGSVAETPVVLPDKKRSKVQRELPQAQNISPEVLPEILVENQEQPVELIQKNYPEITPQHVQEDELLAESSGRYIFITGQDSSDIQEKQLAEIKPLKMQISMTEEVTKNQRKRKRYTIGSPLGELSFAF